MANNDKKKKQQLKMPQDKFASAKDKYMRFENIDE